VLRLLCVYYFFRRGLFGRVRLGNRRMDALRGEFYGHAWRSAAEATGARFTALTSGIGEIERDGRRIRVCASTTSLDTPMAFKRAGDKPMVRSMLARSGIPVPHHITIGIGEFERALYMLRSSPRPLVVKPAVNTGSGAGVSTNVTTVRQLRTAVAWARAFGPHILIEEQIEGDCYRILVMDGEVLDVVVRHPPKIIGDGASTVRQLVREENKLRLEAGTARAQVLIRLDPDIRNTLASQGRNMRSRPAKGEVITLKRVINDNRGRENASANGRLCCAILDSARTAAGVAGVRLAGVDVICCDPSVPLQQSGGAILEVNTTPGFYYHYHTADSSFPVAHHVLKRFFNASTDHQACAPATS
jgi:cyanophycin synthetase